MTKFTDVQLKELFEPVNGRPRFIRDYIAAHPGDYPVYSASLSKPFGYVDEFDFDGHYLTWVMNGYGGRVQEVFGRFSVNRDRGVFVPRASVKVPDLTYVRYAMEPSLMAAAVGRRVDGRLNEYTKIYPETAKEIVIQLILDQHGDLDYARMAELGDSYRRIEAAEIDVRKAHETLSRVTFGIEVPGPSVTLSLSDESYFSLCIGKRVLRVEHVPNGIPIYSANACVPFGSVKTSNLLSFDKPSLLWGIDGIFDWNLILKGEVFATTDHCGRLQVLDGRIYPEYVYWYLKATRWRYGFDRVYRASLQNVKAEVVVTVPVDGETGDLSFDKQRALADTLSKLELNRAESLSALEDVLKARIATEA